MSDAQKKRAMKRLVQDQQELNQEPVANVSAAPLDSNLFEWHCNIRQDDVIYHLILFMPDNYPFQSPSAEFMPMGFCFSGGATMNGKKGTKVCLNIFSDFAMYHTEWKDQKGFGWSPGYTTQTVLMNLVAFLAETAGEGVKSHNASLSKGFKCSDCGHSYDKPFPPLGQSEGTNYTGKGKAGKGVAAKNTSTTKPPTTTNTTTATAAKTNDATPEIIDYISKARFPPSRKPVSRDELYGYGLVVSGPTHRPSLTTPCEFLSGESFYSMKASVGVVHSSLKEELKFFLPMYIQPLHGSQIQNTFEESIRAVGGILPSVTKAASLEDIILKTIPNLMAATVVEFSKGTQHTSDNSLNGYFALHRLFLWALDTYPKLQPLVESHLQEFMEDEGKRTKTACPHIGEWLMLLSASQKYRFVWTDASDAYLSESFRRNVMWFVKDDEKLGYLDTDKEYRIKTTFKQTEVSRKILAFQVLFLDIALPKDLTRKQIIDRYDAHFGFPTVKMVTEMKAACDVIKNKMVTYDDWFKVLKLKPWSQEKLFDKLVDALRFSILTEGYHWTIPKSAGGWRPVLARYKDMIQKAKETALGQPKSAGGKPTPKGAAEEEEEKESAKSRKKGGAVRIEGNVKGRGQGRGAAEPEEAEEEVVVDGRRAPPGARGLGRGRGAGRGGRGGKARKEPTAKRAEMEVEEDEEEEESKPKASAGKGKGGGRGRGAQKTGAPKSSSPGPERKKARK